MVDYQRIRSKTPTKLTWITFCIFTYQKYRFINGSLSVSYEKSGVKTGQKYPVFTIL